MKSKVTQFIATMVLLLSLNNIAAKPIQVNLQPEPYQKETSRWLVRLLEQLHYRPIRLDDAFSVKILDNYIDTLDPNKVYFYAKDVKSFQVYKNDIDNAIKTGEVDMAFRIFTLYIKRIQERTDYALSLLEKPFNYAVAEEYIWNREEQSWVETVEAMNDLWRKRVKNDFLNLKLAGKQDDKIKETLSKRYNRIAKRVSESNNEDVFQYFINSYATLIEPHTAYLAPRTSENFKINMSLSLQGIGALLGEEGEHVTIKKVIKGGPAQKQGELKNGDKIVAVGQGESGSLIDVVGWRVDDVVEKIRGDKGTVVRLSVLSENDLLDTKPHIIKIIRDKVKLEEQAAQYQILKVHSGVNEKKIGVINLPAFYLDFEAKARGDKDYRSTTVDVKKILKKFAAQDVEALIMDLRSNGGGSLVEARDLTGLFIDKGPIVQIKSSRGGVTVDRDTDKSIAWDKPVVVLINRASASASEIFAAALQDYGRAVVVGERSFGKGTVQSLIPLDNYANSNNEHSMGQLKLTLSQFFRINGGSTQNRGVIPDIQFPNRAGSDSYGESEYENALPWTSIKRSSYNMQGDLTSDIPQLRKSYTARELVNPEFAFVKEDYAYYNKLKEDKSVSLSEETRKAESKKQEDRKIQRKQKRESITQGDLDPLITPVDVLYNSEDDVASEVDEPDTEDELTNTKNNSKPADDFVLMEAARIVADLVKLKQQHELIAKTVKKTDVKIDKQL
ncbi:Tail-specific protease precursor [hydrothermal vent metagenome]|uniref:Tail-specific protease n=1 Tax=hydrothermal vent metagenome TaxID=652676 RepID=A0A3B0VB71_9ZZZZ